MSFLACRAVAALACLAATMCAATCGAAPAIAGNEVFIETLGVQHVSQGWGEPHAGKSVMGNPLKIAGKTYERGIGTHSFSELSVDLGGCALRFEGWGGVDDEDAKKGSGGTVDFQVWGDGKMLASTGVMRASQPAKRIEADLKGVKRLLLIVDEAGDGNGYDHADWVDAKLILDPAAKGRPRATPMSSEPVPVIGGADGPEPAIHGPRVVGTTPGRPFLFRIPATGKAPLKFAAKNLPEGLKLDENTGIVTGALKREGTTTATITVKGPRGKASRDLVIVGGIHKLALTPPMGWNSWNVWGTHVDAAKVRAAADAMVTSGLAAHGYCFVNIDDAWEGKRDAAGNITTNDKFGDMKALADYVHAKGLKLGLYSSPGPTTCAGYPGSYQHEQKDADTWAAWGIDYVKHDWCSMGSIYTSPTLAQMQDPYRIMRAALDRCSRDIVFSFCQYGMGDVWKWGPEVGGNLWRTTGDIDDSWSNMANIGFSQTVQHAYTKPGCWSDPDMLVVGRLGWSANPRKTHLTPQEQVTHITQWCMLASPLLIGCDMTQLDDFTLRLLTNDEVLDVNQDPLGHQARQVAVVDKTQVWARPLADGTTAVALYNLGREPAKVTAKWADLGLKGRLPVRDLWRRKDAGLFADEFSAQLPRHGAMMLKVGKAGK